LPSGRGVMIHSVPIVHEGNNPVKIVRIPVLHGRFLL